jgi:membrane-associated HD superfamily phosphohydrolase
MLNKIELLILLREIAYGSECIAALTGLFFLFKYKVKGLVKWFAVFLTYIFINDITSYNIRHWLPNSNNLILYNISTTLTFLFLFFVYHKHIKEKTSKRFIVYFMIFYVITLFISGFYENYLVQLQSIPFLLGAFLLMTSIILYYTELLKSEQIEESTKDFLFWISVGLLIYYVGKMPFRIVRDYYASHNDSSTLFILNSIFTTIMNSCFIVGFLMHRKTVSR